MSDCKRLKGGSCNMPGQFYLYLDQALSPDDVKKLKRYLSTHNTCCRHFEFEKKLRAALRKKQSSERAPKGLKSRLKRKLAGR